MRSYKLARKSVNIIISKSKDVLLRTLDLLAFRIEYKQLLAMWMICILLVPVFAAPVNLAAASNPVNENSGGQDISQFEPVNGDRTVWSKAVTEISLATERLFTPSLKISTSSGSGGEEYKTVENNAKSVLEEDNKSEDKKTEEKESPAETLKAKTSPENDRRETVESVLPEKNYNGSENQVPLNNPVPVAQSTPYFEQLPEVERESVYSYENNLGSPKGQTEADSPNMAAATAIKHRAGIANFSFGLPLASLSGRGINAAINMTYNSRTWNKSYTYDPNINPNSTTSHYTYDVENSWVAPGFSTGLGYLESTASLQSTHYNSSNFSYYTEITPKGITDSDGGKHRFDCIQWQSIPGAYESKCVRYRSNDGSFIFVNGNGWTSNPSNSQSPNTTNYQNVSFTANYPNGSKVWYSGAFGSGTTRKHYPVIVQDNNGNRIRITYKNDQSGRIDHITDTLNRKIKFYYENDTDGNPDKLIAVTIPGMNQNQEIQTIRFYYEDLALTPKTSSGGFEQTSIVDAPTTTRVLKYVYFPSTESGFKYDYHPNYGMITKISRMVGMQISDENTLTTTGTMINAGNWTATTEYDYPDGNTTVTDVPKYSKRTDDWQGRTSATPQITEYNYEVTNSFYKSQIIVNDDGFDVMTESVSDGSGMLVEVSTSKLLNSRQTPELMSKTKYFWSGRNLTKVELTNEKGQTKAVEYRYDEYDNQTKIKEYDFAAAGTLGTLLRTTDIEYEKGLDWLYAYLVGLVKSVKVTVGGTVVSKTLYEYDGNQLTRRDDMDTETHSIFYNPAHPATIQVFCPFDDNVYQGENAPNMPPDGERCVTISNPGYDGSTDYRGNVTKVGQMLDVNATTITDTNSHKSDFYYDIAGNTVAATLSCCHLKTIDYGANFAETGYAFPVREIKGSSQEFVNEAAYNLNTGLVTSTKDENNQITNYEYETDTLRQSKVTYPNGGYVQTEYSDKLAPGSVIGFVRTTATLDANKTVQSYGYFDGRGLTLRSASETADGWSVSAMEYDALGRPVKTYNPFYASAPNGAIPANTASTQVVSYDAFGRVPQVQLQDGTTVSSYFNEQTVTYTAPGGVSITGTASRATDQAGKERRQIVDSLGRVVRVDEPTSAGLGSVSAPNQPTYYFYDGNDNLAKVVQSDGTTVQERAFKYDALSRLTHERQVEASPTLDINGVKGAIDPNKWTKVLKYNLDGLVSEGTDARGVKTTFAYDGLNRVQSVTFSDGTPQITYSYDQARTGFFNKGALTRVETADGGTARPDTPATATEFDYDKMGRVTAHRQSIGAQTYTLEYGYNLAGQMTSEKYPSGRTMAMNYDAKGRLSAIADANRTYLSGLQFQGKGNSLSSMTFGNGTTQSFALNDRLQMTNQELKRGAEVLQKYDYGYGQIDQNGNLDVTKNNGQLAKIESTIGTNKQWTQKFRYDEIGRLDKSEEFRGDNNNPSYYQKFDYDRFGNLYRKNSSNPTTGQATPVSFAPIENSDISKSTNRFTTDTTYDEAGNVIQDSRYRNQNFSYDANGRMYKTQRVNFPNQSNAVYDASGMRVANQVDGVWTFSVYDIGGKKVAEYGGLSATDEGGVKYILSDHQGSNRAVVNNAGYVNSRTDYTAFGEEIQSNIGQRTAQGYASSDTLSQKYALTEKDKATGLDHTWYRKHENQAGRWTSPDPYNGSMNIGDPQSFNRYSYVNNQPINYVDPSGLFASSGGVCYGYDIFYITLKDGIVINVEHLGFIATYCTGGGGAGGAGGGGSAGGGNSGGSSSNQQNQSKDKKKCKQAGSDPKDSTFGNDRSAIEEKLEKAGLMGFISNIRTTREGVTFDINDREGFLNALNANDNFRHNTPFGAAHARDVGANILTVKDFRSFTSGSNTLGPDSVSGLTRSLQIDVGNQRTDRFGNRVTRGYADLDCDNPAQDVVSFFKHLGKVLGL